MNKLQQIIAYICLRYPYNSELSNARLTKLVYLADWTSALLDDRQLTDIRWLFNHYGPYVNDVIDSVKNKHGFIVDNTSTSYGTPKQMVKYIGDTSQITLSNRTCNIIDAVIEKTKTMYFNEFIDYIYSTYPVASNERYSNLDLVGLAKKYKREHP